MAGLRVIAGSARGRKLRLVPGEGTRPISDRVKEALFNILGLDVQDATMLDLFAGTGSVGIEALSRGAAFARFVDRSGRAIEIIHHNLNHTHLAEKSEVLRMDAFALLERPPDRRFDYIFIAPPQYKKLWERALLAVDAHPGWLSDDSWVVVQIDPREDKPLPLHNLIEIDRRRYGNTLLLFYEIQ